MVSLGIALVLVFNGLLLGGGTILGYWWLRQRNDTNGETASMDWREDATDLVLEVQRVAENDEGVVDHDHIQRRLLPLSERLKGHARTAPIEVDQHLIDGVYELGLDCYKVSMEHTTREAVRTGEFLEDKLEDLQTRAEKLETAISTSGYE